MKRINVYVQEDDYEWMTAAAKIHGRPIAQIIRRAIENYRSLEGSVLGESHVPVQDVTSANVKPTEKDNELPKVLERLEKLEKFMYGPILNASELRNDGYFQALPFLPDYMKYEQE